MGKFFVGEDSLVRTIWGRGDTVMLIFAGASAEFALNKSVDWLYYTGRLPADPIGRLFSTVKYAQEILFSEYEVAVAAIDRITAIHKGVEASRSAKIPDSAYRDVLFMLIDYSIRSYELSVHSLNEGQREEVFRVFYRVGERMGLRGLPPNYPAWRTMRTGHLETNLVRSSFTIDLFQKYAKHLGPFRYKILLYAQATLAPEKVRELLSLPSPLLLYPPLIVYKASRALGMDGLLKKLLLPAKYKTEIAGLDKS